MAHAPSRRLRIFPSIPGTAAVLGLLAVVACSSSTDAPAGTALDGGLTSTADDAAGSWHDGATADDATPPADSGAGDVATDTALSSFVLTSGTITEGGTFPAVSTCNGADTSPPLAWSGGPAAAKSYALVLHDVTIDFLHAVVYDIPPSVASLAADLPSAYAPATPAGAHETKNFKGSFGWAGPCPPNEHVYEIVLYALDTATLPGAAPTLTLADAQTAIKAHALAQAKLTAKYKQP